MISTGSRPPVNNEIGQGLLQLAVRELGRLVRARYGTLGPRDLDVGHTPALKQSPLITVLSYGILMAERQAQDGDVQAAVVSVLEDFCNVDVRNNPNYRCGFYFHHETTSNRAWLATSREQSVVLIDLAKSSILAVDKSLCALEVSWIAPHRVDLHIEGPCKGDEGMWVRDLSPELSQWFGQVGI
jgi:hypothetical protein